MIKLHAKVKQLGEDHLKRIAAAVKKAHDCYVEIGWPTNVTYPGTDITPGRVALWNEYGTYNADGSVHTPARPFMRPAMDENHERIKELQADQIVEVAFKGVTVETALTHLGTAVKDMIVAKIDSNIPPPNAPSTLARKEAKGQGSNTLIATGTMRNKLGITVHLNKEMKEEKEAAHKAAGERAARRVAYREQKQKERLANIAARKEKRDKKAAQKSAQKQLTQKGKTVKRFANQAKKQAVKATRNVVKQTQKSVLQTKKVATKATTKGIKNASKRISTAIKGKAARKPKGKT